MQDGLGGDVPGEFVVGGGQGVVGAADRVAQVRARHASALKGGGLMETPDFGEKLIYFSGNSILDSRKVRCLVPEFVCTPLFVQGIRRTIQFYRDNPELQVVHVEFDAAMDRIAEKHSHA